MTRGTFISEDQRKAFLAEIDAVCKKHGVSIEHEDTQGGFVFTPYSEPAAQWLAGGWVEDRPLQRK